MEDLKKNKIKAYLKRLKKDGKIKDFGVDNFGTWRNVPCVLLNNDCKIALADTFYYKNSLCIKTIYDYSMQYIEKRYIKTILKCQEEIKQYNITSYKDLKKYFDYKKMQKILEV